MLRSQKDEKDDVQEIQSGKEKIINHVEFSKENIKEKEDKYISFMKEVLPYMLPLTSILTVKDLNIDFVKMLNDIKTTPELLEIFNDQCLIWWNKKDLIDIIREIIIKYFDKNSNTYNISIQIKMSLHDLIDKPKELLELINECLKPKTVEKKIFGEVFTPMDFINNNMLKDISDYWMIKYDEDIWMNEKLTWYNHGIIIL